MSATREHDETPPRNVICCLLALEIADYDAKPVFDQIRFTQELRQLLSDATTQMTSDDVVSMLREDGALLSFLADPEECLTTALAIREATLAQGRYCDLPLRMGINLGKAQIAEDEFGNPYVNGEGKQDADRLMRQGPPRQISAARQFVELLARTAPELGKLFEYRGLYSYSVGPPLCLYRISVPQDGGSERLAEQTPTPAVSSGIIDPPTQLDLASVQAPARNRNWLHRSWLSYALLPLLAGAAMMTWSSRLRVDASVSRPPAQLAAAIPQATTSEAAQSLSVQVRPQQAAPSAKATPSTLANEPKAPRPPASWRARSRNETAASKPHINEHTPGIRNKGAAPQLESARTTNERGSTRTASVGPPKSATLVLAVKPWGEVYVDGMKVGVTPPLRKLELAPGRRLITITNSSLPSYYTVLTADPGAQMTVAHDFGCISTREKTCREGFGKGLELPSRIRLETAEATR